MAFSLKAALLALALGSVGWASLGVGQTAGQTADKPPAPLGTVTGTIVDPTGAVVAAAAVTLTQPDQTASQEASSDDKGQFTFTKVGPGNFQLAVTAPGFAPQTSSGTLLPGEIRTVSPIVLAVATNVTDVEVALSRTQVAEEQIKDEEKQRIIGIVPNFYVTYDSHALPLTSRQKFKLAEKSVVDPFTFLVVAGTAGIEQAQNHFIEYGQGMQGYFKRFGATYADTVSSTFIGGAILPSLLKQDPRYFYKGTGSTSSRFMYALRMSVICKGDNGRWQFNYSNVLGSLAAGGLSNLYYPALDRDSAALTFENAAIGLGSNAVTNILQEFIVRKLTPHANHPAPQPQ